MQSSLSPKCPGVPGVRIKRTGSAIGRVYISCPDPERHVIVTPMPHIDVMKKIVIVSDAWGGQTNGVVTTLTRTKEFLTTRGIECQILGPDRFRSMPMPGYAEIRLAWFPYRKLARLLNESSPCAIHIATEGPLGSAARHYCLKHEIPFTTSFHTRFPDYVNARLPIPKSWIWAWLRHFHKPSQAIMTATQSLEDELASRGFNRMTRWSRGVDLEQFIPRFAPTTTRKKLIYLGRVAVEKNVEAFLDLQGQIDADFIVVGDGPAREALELQYPTAQWRGTQKGAVLAASLAEADCLVFPSRTDTFGLVMIEAMACGTPVAAYPVQGPLEVVESGVSGELDEDLCVAARRALNRDRHQVYARATEFTWDRAGEQFLQTVTRMSQQRHASLTPASS